MNQTSNLATSLYKIDIKVTTMGRLAITLLLLVQACAWSLTTKQAIESGTLRLGMSKEEVSVVLDEPGEFFQTQRLPSGEVLDILLYEDWVWVYSYFGIKYYWVAYVNGRVTGFGVAGTKRTVQCTTNRIGATFQTSCF